jgi:hypothetical protein
MIGKGIAEIVFFLVLQPLPRLLWELENKHPTTSLTALRMLHNAGRYARPDGPISAALQELQAQMTPLYVSAAMPVKASAGKVKKGSRQGPTQRVGEEQTSARLMPGPLVRLPHECQASNSPLPIRVRNANSCNR